MRISGTSGAWARWGWLITTLALGAVVIIGSAANYRSSRRAADQLVRAQAQLYRDLMLGMDRDQPGPRRTRLDSLVAAHSAGGLRFVGWVSSGGRISASGGAPHPTRIEVPVTQQVTLDRVDDRVRAFFPPPRGRPPGPPPPGDSARGGPPTLMLEFEPLVAQDLMGRAFRSLLVAALVALVLVMAGIGFWRFSQRSERQERRMAEARRLLSLGEMSAVLAHEIRNPLASLKGHAQLLLERLPEPSVERRKAGRIVEEAGRLEALTSELLDFARTGPLDLRPVAPAALLRAAVSELPGSPITIDDREAPERWDLDERRMGHAVLGNLLRNAVQALPAERPPAARAALENGSLVFTIRDFGPGLPAGGEERLFDPFFTTRTTGTGLGLAVARRIVELHGGRIEAGNAPGGGARFRVELPRLRA